MTKYTNEKKEHALSQMSAPHNKPVAAVAQLTGVPEATLYLWRKQAREQGRAVPGDGQNPEQWSSADKFAVVLEAAPLNEAELAAYRGEETITCSPTVGADQVRVLPARRVAHFSHSVVSVGPSRTRALAPLTSAMVPRRIRFCSKRRRSDRSAFMQCMLPKSACGCTRGWVDKRVNGFIIVSCLSFYKIYRSITWTYFLHYLLLGQFL